jgi:hypothetical protein
MRASLGVVLIVFFSAAACCAQFEPYKSNVAFTVGHRDGVTERTVSFLEASGEVRATAFVPDSEAAVPGIVFSLTPRFMVQMSASTWCPLRGRWQWPERPQLFLTGRLSGNHPATTQSSPTIRTGALVIGCSLT